MVNIFERLSAGRPPELKPPPTPLPTSWAARELLNWLQNVWKEPTVRISNIYQYGPNCIRDKENALDAARILERYGWLVRMKTHRHNERKWQIAIEALDLSEDNYRARYDVLPG
jgi:hypothetical protein